MEYLQKEFDKLIKDGKVIFKREYREGERGFFVKIYRSEVEGDFNHFRSLSACDNSYMNRYGTYELEKLLGGKYFDFPKPVSFIKELVRSSTEGDDLILDFFAGSATTAEAVMRQNIEDGGRRKFICVQLPEVCREGTTAYEAGFKTISDIAKERIKKAIRTMKENINISHLPLDLGFKVKKLEYPAGNRGRPSEPGRVRKDITMDEFIANSVKKVVDRRNRYRRGGKKVTFSSLVEQALESYFYTQKNKVLKD